MITTAADVTVHHLAAHSLLLALPAVIPAFLVVGIVIAIAVADRRRGDDEDDGGEDDGGEKGGGEKGGTDQDSSEGSTDPTSTTDDAQRLQGPQDEDDDHDSRSG